MKAVTGTVKIVEIFYEDTFEIFNTNEPSTNSVRDFTTPL